MITNIEIDDIDNDNKYGSYFIRYFSFIYAEITPIIPEKTHKNDICINSADVMMYLNITTAITRAHYTSTQDVKRLNIHTVTRRVNCLVRHPSRLVK